MNAKRLSAALAVSLLVLFCAVALGSSFTGFENGAVVRNIRLPRVLLAFMSGGALAVSGAVFQSVLKNQLASPYIMGVSSGASLGAALVMLTGIRIAAHFTLPLAGFVFGLAAVFIVIGLSARLDRNFSNNTIILFGMVFSLFVNAVLITLLSLFREELKSLLAWQLGSFALKGWTYVKLLAPCIALGLWGVFRSAREMDILSFGEAEAEALGVPSRGVRARLFFFAALLTGSSTALSGAVGFVDLIAPHVSRRIAGPAHRVMLPLSFLIGGSLMAAADLAARTIISPSELPVGAVTALIGAPFFVWVYFGGRKT
ncbi:MAG: iron ABC transporter permease [Treponema sp.]|jgi:iron complex transport system permease protein|nr:iron ABC transporter permease [Treponema sp.]